MARSISALITSLAILTASLTAAPARAVDHVTYFIGHADEILNYVDGSDCASTTYWTDGDGAYDSDDDIVQDVVDLASDGDTIHLCAGTWEFASYVDVQTVDVSIVGEGIDETIVDGGAIYNGDGELTSDGTEIFVAGDYVRIADMTIQHGGGGEGGSYGAVYGGDVDVERVRFYRNASPDSGGAIWSDSEVSVAESEFEENEAASYGGAIWAGTATISASQLLNNHVDLGSGGAIVSLGDTLLIDSNFAGNVANFSGPELAEQGGGVIATEGALTINGGTFTGNAAVIIGGAIYATGGEPVIVRGARFTDNVSLIVGGAMYAGGLLTLENSTLEGNESSMGGAIFASDSVIVRKSSMRSNRATGETYGVFGDCVGGGGAVLAAGDVVSTATRYHANVSEFPEGIDFSECEGFFLGGLLIGSGGAIAAGGQFSSYGDRFDENHADSWGGAVSAEAGFFEDEGGPLQASRILRSSFTGNSAGSAELAAAEVPLTGAGGAYLQLGGDLSIESSTFIRNSTGNAGGALAYQALGEGNTVRLVQNSFSGNRAGLPEFTTPNLPVFAGAALIVSSQADETTIVIARNTFTSNSVEGDGGGLYLFARSLTGVTRNVLRGNRAARGGGVVLVVCEGRVRRIASEFRSSNRVSGNRARKDRDIFVDQTNGICIEPS